MFVWVYLACYLFTRKNIQDVSTIVNGTQKHTHTHDGQATWRVRCIVKMHRCAFWKRKLWCRCENQRECGTQQTRTQDYPVSMLLPNEVTLHVLFFATFSSRHMSRFETVSPSVHQNFYFQHQFITQPMKSGFHRRKGGFDVILNELDVVWNIRSVRRSFDQLATTYESTYTKKKTRKTTGHTLFVHENAAYRQTTRSLWKTCVYEWERGWKSAHFHFCRYFCTYAHQSDGEKCEILQLFEVLSFCASCKNEIRWKNHLNSSHLERTFFCWFFVVACDICLLPECNFQNSMEPFCWCCYYYTPRRLLCRKIVLLLQRW